MTLNQARNETRFLVQVKRYFADAPAKARRATDAIYIAEGDHACRWLSREPPVTAEAPNQTSGELYRRYVRTVEPTPTWPFGRRGVRGDVIYNAWDFLCPNLRDSRTWTPPPEAD
ncbi:hypothetical protein [Nocardioides daeguensis]|nr:hypothetical protein [Nocardioides daeguensis]MBV6728864.1 hypothetical protein [Nocardioides daeguensis]MCR1773385.1 hypothetical protein [Nocardioides daeguensis]